MSNKIKIERDEHIRNKKEDNYYITGADELKRKRDFNIRYKGRNTLPVMTMVKGLRYKIFDSCWCCGHTSVMFYVGNSKPVSICIEDDRKKRHRPCRFYKQQYCIALNKKNGRCNGRAS